MLASRWPCKFFSGGTTGSSILFQLVELYSGGILLQISGHSSFLAIVTIWELRSFWPESTLKLRPWFSPVIPWSIEVVSKNTFRCHLGRWSTLLREYCSVSCFVFDVVVWERNSPLVFLVVFCKFGVLQVTEVHQIRDVNCSSILLRFDLTFFTSQAGHFFRFSHPFSTAALASGIFTASWIESGLCARP